MTRNSGPEAETFSHIPEAHAEDPRERFVTKPSEGLTIIYPDPELQKLPPCGPRVQDKTFSDNPEAHAT